MAPAALAPLVSGIEVAPIDTATEPGVHPLRKTEEWNGAISVVHPELELAAEVNPALASSLQAIYATTEKLKTEDSTAAASCDCRSNCRSNCRPGFPRRFRIIRCSRFG